MKPRDVPTIARNHARTRWYRARYRANVRFGAGVHLAGALKVTGAGRVEIGERVYFDGAVGATRIDVAAGAVVRIGEWSYVNGLAIVAAADVTIGTRCLLGDAFIVTTNFHSTSVDRHAPDARVRVAPITIGDNVWIASQAAILPGVSIGSDAVVAYRSVITADVAPGAIVSSHEQRVVRRLYDQSR